MPVPSLEDLDTDIAGEEFGPPEIVEIEPIHACNIRCTMCHVSYAEPTNERLDIKFLDGLRGLAGRWAKVGSEFEPAMHPEFAGILAGLSEVGMRIDLTTNGTLLSQKLIDRIAGANLKRVTFSFDGMRKETFERIRRGANYERTLERILNFKRAIRERGNAGCRFTINFTVLNSNIDEIPEAVDFWEEHGFDNITFIYMVIRSDVVELVQESPRSSLDRLQQCLEQAARRVIENNYRISIRSPAFLNTPLRDEYPDCLPKDTGLAISRRPDAYWPVAIMGHHQLGEYPGMPVPCRSPFKYANLWYDGRVRLCKKFFVGSIYEKRLLEIWNDAHSELVRARVRRSPKICHHCDLYRLCIRSNRIDYAQVESDRPDLGAPILIGERHGHNLVQWADEYYAVPHSSGPFDVRLIDVETKGGIRDTSLESLSMKLDQKLGFL